MPRNVPVTNRTFAPLRRRTYAASLPLKRVFRGTSTAPADAAPRAAEQAPYNVVVVELAEAPRIRLVGNVVTGPGAPLDSVPPERIRIKARVQVVFGRAGLPQWVLERP
ncbi:OB-fold domain-containing protein [Streptomyces sp. NPDC005202]|uniref:OB-fold domain-containing protein n=1 Tax=Streptomyces sp. NPDC005202 TaxID=3157021 RepID=UPI0033B5B7A6